MQTLQHAYLGALYQAMAGREVMAKIKNYDPKLRKAMAEIKIILVKYDIGAFVTLESKMHSEFQLFIEPSWSLARFLIKKGIPVGIHFKVRKAHPKDTDATAGMLYSIRDLCGKTFLQMEQLSRQLEESVKVIHVPFGKQGITNEDR